MFTKKVIFLGSKPIGFNCLLHLLQNANVLNVDVIGILTQQRLEFGADSNLAMLAEEHKVPLILSLDDLPECDILYSVQYHQILKPHHIAKAKQIAVNLHTAPLPEYRGSNQFSMAIIEDKKEFGTTIHAIDQYIDHGDILFQKRFKIPDNCWVSELYDLTYNASLLLFKQTLQHIVNANYQPVSQSLLEAKYGSSLHYRKEIKDLKQIDLSWDKDKIERHIRATSMPGFEAPYCMIDGKKVFYTVVG
ncbi:MAG: hypothetical protein EBX41_03255 [Chitinophagia bacterium]|nr:hypothetical protein [Chitinophagia bacterium]